MNQSQKLLETPVKNHLKRTRLKKKEWMTDEILTLMDQRRILKNKNTEEYRSLHKTIKRKIKAAKEESLAGKCSEIRELDRIKDYLNTHKRIKQMTYTRKKTTTGILVDSNGRSPNSSGENQCNKREIWT